MMQVTILLMASLLHSSIPNKIALIRFFQIISLLKETMGIQFMLDLTVKHAYLLKNIQLEP